MVFVVPYFFLTEDLLGNSSSWSCCLKQTFDSEALVCARWRCQNLKGSFWEQCPVPVWNPNSGVGRWGGKAKVTSCNICLYWPRKSNFQTPRWTFHSLSWTQQQCHSSAPWYQQGIRNVPPMSSSQSPTLAGKGRAHGRGSSDSFAQLSDPGKNWSQGKILWGNRGGQKEVQTDCKLIPQGPAVKLLWNCCFGLPRTQNLSGKLR